MLSPLQKGGFCVILTWCARKRTQELENTYVDLLPVHLNAGVGAELKVNFDFDEIKKIIVIQKQ